MKNNLFRKTSALWPAAALIALTAGMILQLQHQGRIWWCKCGRAFIWSGEIWSEHTSQHILDHYSFTHVLHGVLFCGILYWLLPKLRYSWKLWIAVFIEALWELLENTQFIIQRYREATIDQGYEGDSIANSVSDLACCAIGFMIAAKIGLKRSIALFIVTELILLFWIRDNLTLNVIMLIHPIEAIKQWQMGG